MTSGPVVALELLGSNAIQAWRSLLGPTSTAKAQAEQPSSIRARFGTDNTRNACHGSDSTAAAAREIAFFFGPASRVHGATDLAGATLAVVKPHAVQQKLAGKIVSAIVDGGFTVAAMQLFVLDRANAEAFLEVYKGVLPEYGDMLAELTSGAALALALRHPDGNAQQRFRTLAGPYGASLWRHRIT